MNEILIEECVGFLSFARTRLIIWHKDAVAYPTRQILGNFFKYVDVKTKDKATKVKKKK